MEIEISFPGGKRVAACVSGHTVETDQPAELGGADSAPTPYDLFLASLGTCAGIYVLGFLQARGLPTDGLRLRQIVTMDEATKLPANVRFEITLPAGVPQKYRGAIVRAAEGCKVKKTLAHAPSVDVMLVEQTEVSSCASA
jgi:putative redox protein